MSASTQHELGEKMYEHFLKKLGKKPASVLDFQVRMGRVSAATVRRHAQRAVFEGKAVESKKGNAVLYALPSATTEQNGTVAP
jgi:hypothetical protein